MLDNDYHAHSGTQPKRSDWQTLRSHLQGVAVKARSTMLACKVSGNSFEAAYTAGPFHDLGKYRSEFQQMLRGACLATYSRIFCIYRIVIVKQRVCRFGETETGLSIELCNPKRLKLQSDNQYIELDRHERSVS